ncbi:MAG: hypothetical protein LPK19_16515 [Hymenobacteraceae bacterium]|nr:hypothetical protein [Hymenobacteraceae bacterium]MDX5397856.1 hypothetical protein [Hymenobacteraceae bacterium]MDX5513928.1 hypothetical protein [Hymenobacteraceae bacterium]
MKKLLLPLLLCLCFVSCNNSSDKEVVFPELYQVGEQYWFKAYTLSQPHDTLLQYQPVLHIEAKDTTGFSIGWSSVNQKELNARWKTSNPADKEILELNLALMKYENSVSVELPVFVLPDSVVNFLITMSIDTASRAGTSVESVSADLKKGYQKSKSVFLADTIIVVNGKEFNCHAVSTTFEQKGKNFQYKYWYNPGIGLVRLEHELKEKGKFVMELVGRE